VEGKRVDIIDMVDNVEEWTLGDVSIDVVLDRARLG
jgi:hypothetical protein